MKSNWLITLILILLFQNILLDVPVWLNTLIDCGLQCFLSGKCLPVHCTIQLLDPEVSMESNSYVCLLLVGWFAGDDTMTGDGGEYLRPEDLRELGDDSLPSSQFLDGMNYLRYSLEGGRSDRYLPGYGTFLMLLLHENSFCCKCVKSLCGASLLGVLLSICSLNVAVTTWQEEGVVTLISCCHKQGMGGQGLWASGELTFWSALLAQGTRRGAMDWVILHWAGSECIVCKVLHSFWFLMVELAGCRILVLLLTQ